MGLLSKLFSKSELMTKSIELMQSKQFKGFKRYKITNFGYDEAEENIKKIKAINPKMDFTGTVIRLDYIICETRTEALAVYLADLRIGTIFFNDTYLELLKAYKENRITAAHIKTDELGDFYLLVKMEE